MSLVLVSACENDDFLERQRLIAVSPETYFTKANDFKLYTNQFYNDLGNATEWLIWGWPDEDGTDNLVKHDPQPEFNAQIILNVTDPQWSNTYSRIRGLNIMLSNSHKAEWDDIKVYLAEGRFFRAWNYFKLLRRFGGVPWINKPLNPNNLGELQTPRAPREVIADSIIADLDFAIANLPSHDKVKDMRLSKEVALTLKSRICLYEGTWEKYHGKAGTPFAVNGSNGSKYLLLAMNAAQEVINSGFFSISKIAGPEPYYNFFNRQDYSTVKEVIFWRKTSRELTPRSASRSIWLGSQSNLGMTKNLVDAYLCTDGKPLSLTSLETTDDSISGVVNNRDPRLAQSIFVPGKPYVLDDATDNVIQVFQFPSLTDVRTGYHPRKGGSIRKSVLEVNGDQIGIIYFRYAEVLLNYIEAKAELNESGEATLTQNDFDISINAIRARVDMPNFNYSEVINDTNDPYNGIIPWYIVEIRRERRVELALEGFRKDDIFRWAAVDKLLKNQLPRGTKYQWFVDHSFYRPTSIKYVDSNGYLSPWINTEFETNGGYLFRLNQDYLYPIPSQEMLLGNYESNNPGWN